MDFKNLTAEEFNEQTKGLKTLTLTLYQVCIDYLNRDYDSVIIYYGDSLEDATTVFKEAVKNAEENEKVEHERHAVDVEHLDINDDCFVNDPWNGNFPCWAISLNKELLERDDDSEEFDAVDFVGIDASRGFYSWDDEDEPYFLRNYYDV
jgi:hypothetical protein